MFENSGGFNINDELARARAKLDEKRTSAGPERELPPIFSRDELLVSSWIKKDIPLRDHLLGGVMCTTSRWFVYGETGIGKTLLGGAMAGAISAGEPFLIFAGQGDPRTVMYLDGELPQETFKERMRLIAERYGDDIPLYGYNREALGDDGMPPLNTDAGQKWLRHEIDFIKPDAIFFDSIFCLLVGSLKDEDSWAPMKGFVRELTARRIAQVWFNQANDIGKSFGDKTRGWEMDTIIKLSKVDEENEGEGEEIPAIKWEFEKARLRVPANFEQFRTLLIRPGNEWEVKDAPRKMNGKGVRWRSDISPQFLAAYDRLADSVTKSPGFDGKPVLKVSTDAIREELKSRGFLQTNDGEITSTGRSELYRVKADFLKSGKLIEKDGFIWRAQA